MSDLKELSKGSDAISEYSMDSAYQSQSGTSRRGGDYQSSPVQDRMNQLPSFMAHDISPSLASDSFAPFSESRDIHQGHALADAGNLDFGSGSPWFANDTAAQDFSTYSPSMARGMHDSSMNAFTWTSNEASTYNNYAPAYQLSNETDMFSSHNSTQRRLTRPRLETSAASASYFAPERSYSQSSANAANLRASVTPVQPLQTQSFSEAGFDAQQGVHTG